MTAIRFLALAAAIGVAGFAAADDEKKADGMLVGKWKVTEGKKAGNAIGDDAKKGHYEISKDTIKIFGGEGDKVLFVMKYTLDAKKTPAEIDIEITEGPSPDVKGSKAKGIVEVKGDELKICYEPMGGDRPTKFDGEKFYSFTLKKEKDKKDEKKDK